VNYPTELGWQDHRVTTSGTDFAAASTLYVSDLDFTLLRSDARLSTRTVEVVNALVDSGGLFTFASARSYTSAARVTADLHLQLPLITYGGAIRVDPRGGAITDVRPIPPQTVQAIIAVTADHAYVEPLLFTMLEDRDRVCWRETHTTTYVRSFASARVGDPRLLPLPDWAVVSTAPVFYATLIGERRHIDELRHSLGPHLTDCFVTVGPDVYHPTQTWLEISSRHATKAAAARRLVNQLHATELVVFGDNLIDVPLFEIADHACAVANAVPELLAIADEVIPSNDQDGVAAWLTHHVLHR
jgi:5-amino-6-(5-phospho-D-ribitylamino)uracil phosphatase